jgi:hypothetical protein
LLISLRRVLSRWKIRLRALRTNLRLSSENFGSTDGKIVGSPKREGRGLKK